MMETDEPTEVVKLYIYDLSKGMANMLSTALLGKHIKGIWHTGVVVYGKEYFFGGQGIQICVPGGTVLGNPGKIELIGKTFVPFQVFRDYVRGLSESTFRGIQYNLISHNCNTFSEDLCQFLCGKSIPKDILDLPQEFLATPLGQSIAPLIETISEGQNSISCEQQNTRDNSPGFVELNNQIEAARLHSLSLQERRNTIRDKNTKREQKKEKPRKKVKKPKESTGAESGSKPNKKMSDTQDKMNGSAHGDIPPEMLPSEKVLEEEAKERAEEEERRKRREPAKVFRTVDPKVELEGLVKFLDGKLSKEEECAIEELHQYLIEGEGSWALGDNFLMFVGRILRDPTLSSETRVHMIRVLADAALKDDVVLILHQDRRDHVLMNFSQDIDKHTPEEQQAWALFICNLFENVSSSEWLLYISEWPYNNQATSNIRGTTKVAVHCLLATCPTLQDIGTCIIHNLGIKEVFDDIAVELTMAVLQFLNSKPNEEHLYRTLRALLRFTTVSSDVGQFIQMIGPHPNTFHGTSPRIDAIIAEINKRVPVL